MTDDGAAVPTPSALGVALAERDEVVEFLDAVEAAVGAPLVDEAERDRLARLTAAEPPGSHVVGERHWSPLVAREGDRVVGYVGVLHPLATEVDAIRRAIGEVAVVRDGDVHGAALTALVDAAVEVALEHDARELEVWLRHAREEQVLAVASAGFAVRRRLAVLGRALVRTEAGAATARVGDDEGPPIAERDGIVVRPYRGAEDDAAVVEVLAAAHAGGPDAGWDPAAFAARRRAPWFVAEDLLLADSTDPAAPGVVGVHWCKRRGGGVGEVHNLAVRPGAQGRGVGAVLLAAGLARLAAVGCREVLLWVDLDNERALRLYRAAGFTSCWEDVALVRTLTR